MIFGILSSHLKILIISNYIAIFTDWYKANSCENMKKKCNKISFSCSAKKYEGYFLL